MKSKRNMCIRPKTYYYQVWVAVEITYNKLIRDQRDYIMHYFLIRNNFGMSVAFMHAGDLQIAYPPHTVQGIKLMPLRGVRRMSRKIQVGHTLRVDA